MMSQPEKYRVVGNVALVTCPEAPVIRLYPEDELHTWSPEQPRLYEGRRMGNLQFICLALLSTLVVVVLSLALEALHEGRAISALDTATMGSVSVARGDTLWSIAEQYRVDGVSTAQLVSWLRAHNGLESSLLMPGQRLEVPLAHDGVL